MFYTMIGSATDRAVERGGAYRWRTVTTQAAVSGSLIAKAAQQAVNP
jgi:hypothetical protein